MRIEKINNRERKGRMMKAMTKIDYFMGIIAIIILLYIGYRHWDTWGKTNFMEGFFALAGILGIDFIKHGDFGRGKPYKPLEVSTFPRFLILFIIVALVQIISASLIPFTIDNIELALSIVFASVAEELFFRGVLINIFKKIGDMMQPGTKYALFDFVGMVISSLFFAFIHTNYYNNVNMMIALFLGGMVFSLFYYKFNDLTANIMAHFLLNIVVVWQSGLLVQFAPYLLMAMVI